MAENFEGIKVKNSIQGDAFPIRRSVRVATVSPGTLSTDFEDGDTIDGIVLATGDRILIKDQASAVENGIYNVQATGTPVRADDFNVGTTASTIQMYVSSGTANSQTTWICNSPSGSDIVGTDNITFEQATGKINGLTPGSYTTANITVDANGRITTAANGAQVWTRSTAGTITNLSNVDSVTSLIFSYETFTNGVENIVNYIATMSIIVPGATTSHSFTIRNPGIPILGTAQQAMGNISFGSILNWTPIRITVTKLPNYDLNISFTTDSFGGATSSFMTIKGTYYT